ncbi:hypothetical protein LBMAG42_28540 [Deltaproteobacteria bacterium]|nr:hypothetical protein LBMAG42_28540 [Deltaproteobacteria bacterium]
MATDPISPEVTPRQRVAVGLSLLSLVALAPLAVALACQPAEDHSVKPQKPVELKGDVKAPPAAVPAAPLDPMPRRLWTQPGAPAKKVADALRAQNPDDAALLDRMAKTPAGVWLGGWTKDPKKTVASIVAEAARTSAVPVLVAYNIPNRDCGQHSAGGKADGKSYLTWISEVAAGVGSGDAIVVLEPDALTQLDCLTAAQREERLGLLRAAVTTFQDHPGARVYLDGGHPDALSVTEMAARLDEAGVHQSRGFALNVSNFVSTKKNILYGDQVARILGDDLRYVIDTSRNGHGANGEWCNPFGRALGEDPTLNPGLRRGDAFLWVKRPGESDGTCHGGPAAGQFWGGYALELAKAAWEPELPAVVDATR